MKKKFKKKIFQKSQKTIHLAKRYKQRCILKNAKKHQFQIEAVPWFSKNVDMRDFLTSGKAQNFLLLLLIDKNIKQKSLHS